MAFLRRDLPLALEIIATDVEHHLREAVSAALAVMDWYQFASPITKKSGDAELLPKMLMIGVEGRSTESEFYWHPMKTKLFDNVPYLRIWPHVYKEELLQYVSMSSLLRKSPCDAVWICTESIGLSRLFYIADTSWTWSDYACQGSFWGIAPAFEPQSRLYLIN